MYVNSVITVYDDGTTNPMVQVHNISTDDTESRKVFQQLCDNARDDGWKQFSTSSTYQYNFVKGSPRKTLTIKLDSSSFGFGMSASK